LVEPQDVGTGESRTAITATKARVVDGPGRSDPTPLEIRHFTNPLPPHGGEIRRPGDLSGGDARSYGGDSSPAGEPARVGGAPRSDTAGAPAAVIPSFHGLVGRHPSIQSVIEVIRRVAATDATVLISGESGTGKELVAEAIHALSARRQLRFVPVHCGAIPEDLLESEMFGHEKGAFTGAIASRVGRFRIADQGTIFLDEIGEMSPKLQVKLLRILEDGRFEPVGSVATHQVDVRVVAASNRKLEDAVAARVFREDLFYRLRVVPIDMPPLRRRREDIPLLVRHFLSLFHTQKGLPLREVTEDAMEILVRHRWPGNVRELRNALEQVLVLGTVGDFIRPADLPAHIVSSRALDAPPASAAPWEFGAQGIDFYREMEAIEDRIILQALRLSSGNKKEAARLLRVNRTTLLEKLKRKRQQDSVLGRLLNEGVAHLDRGPTSDGAGEPVAAWG
jgi:transcriptional regulator with PAS, ATPase and Fis domain